MNTNWILSVLSSASMFTAMTLLVVFVKNYTIPHGSTYTFTPKKCKVTGAFCLRPPNLDNQYYTEFDLNSNDSITPSQIDDVQHRVSHLIHGARNDMVQGVSSSEHETRSSIGDKSKDKSGINGIPVLNISLDFSNIYQYDEQLGYVSNETGFENNMNITRSTMFSSLTKYLQQSINQSLNEKHKVSFKDIPTTYDTNTAGCVIVLIDIVETAEYVETLPLIQDPWVYYSMVETDAGPQMQCACPDCTISYMPESQEFTVRLNELTLQKDKHLPCHINIKAPEDVLLYKMSAIFVLNLMLWPTLLFIIGFVGLFFSCLLLQYESCNLCGSSNGQ